MIAANHHIRQCFQRHRLYGAGLNYWYQLPSALPERQCEMHCRRHEVAQVAGIGNISKRFPIESIHKKSLLDAFLKETGEPTFL
jgi:hypothetical protein